MSSKNTSGVHLDDMNGQPSGGALGRGRSQVVHGSSGIFHVSTWPRSEDQVPINVGDHHYKPLFPYGWGLTTR